MKPAELTQTISDTFPDLRKSERKVADFVLNNLLQVIRMRIVDLAQEANVSEPTVVGFAEQLVVRVSRILNWLWHSSWPPVPAMGRLQSRTLTLLGNIPTRCLILLWIPYLKVRESLVMERLDAAVAAICAAQKVEFYGFGASAAVAFDAQHKFFRLQITSAAYSDPHLQNMSATSLQAGDVVMAISQSGRTQALLDSMDLVKKAGAIVIALAPSGSPIARSASIAIEVDAKEDFQIYTPLSSRIAHLAVIDVLAVGVAQKKGPQLQEHLQQLQEGLSSLRSN